MSPGWKIFTAVCILIPAGFGIYVGVNVYHLLQICYNIKKYEIVNINLSTLSLRLTLQIKNPSGLSVGMDGYEMVVLLNGVRVAAIVNSTPKVLESGQYTDVVIPITIQWNKTFTKSQAGEILQYFMQKQYDKIIFNISGQFNGSLLKIPIHKKINMNYSLEEIVKNMDTPSQPC